MTQALMKQVEETSNSSKETRWIRTRDLSKYSEIVVSFSSAQLGVKLLNDRIEGTNASGRSYAVVLAEVQCNSDAAHVPVGSYVTRVGTWEAHGAVVSDVIAKIRSRVSSGGKVEVAFLSWMASGDNHVGVEKKE